MTINTEIRRGSGAPVQPQNSDARSPMVWQLVALAGAIGLLLLAVLHPAFRHPEGHLSGRFVLPLAAAVALAGIGFSTGTQVAAAARWLALCLLGQAAALQLMRAGMMVGYQHYERISELASRDVFALLLIVAQSVIVLNAARVRLGAWLNTVSTLLGPWRSAFLAVAFVLTSATLSKAVSDYVGELLLASFIQLINLAAIILAMEALPQSAAQRLRQRFDALLGPADVSGGGVDRFALIAAAWIFAACGFLAYVIYQNHPHVPDEVVYLYHARYFAKGMLSMPLPPVPAAFDLDLMTYEPTRWYSPVPPGWPAVLALGVRLGAPWLVNPALSALGVVLTYVLLREIYDRRLARLAVLLLCASPWFVFMGMNFMTHALSLFCALGGAIAVARLRRDRSLLWAVPGGVAIGIMAMIRPLEGLTVAVLLGFWALGGFPWRARRLAAVSTLALVSIATGALTLPYNAQLAGDPFTFPLMAYTDSVYGPGTNALGFGANRGLGWPGLDPFPGHGPIDVLVNGNMNSYSVNVELLGWSIGSVLPLLLVLLLRGRLQRADRWMLISVAAVIGVHSFYWFSGGPDFGARYWYLIIIPCIALVARGLVKLGDGLAQTSARSDAPTRVLSGALALAFIALITFFPWRAVDKYYHYRNMRPDVRRIAREHHLGRSLILVRGKRHPDYASAASYNPLDLHAPVPIYVWDCDPQITRQALEAFRDRDVWIVDGPTRTGRGFRIVAGPIAAQDLLSGRVTVP